MNKSWKYIFDKSACLSKRQLSEYAARAMSPEEQHAVEHHINGCTFCSDAVDGVKDRAEVLETMGSLNGNFIVEHFGLTHPQVHLNSIAPTVARVPTRPRRKIKVPPVFRGSNVAAAVLLVIGVLWYLDFSKDNSVPGQQPTTHQPRRIVEHAAKASPVTFDEVVGSPEPSEVEVAEAPVVPSVTEVPATLPAVPAAAAKPQAAESISEEKKDVQPVSTVSSKAPTEEQVTSTPKLPKPVSGPDTRKSEPQAVASEEPAQSADALFAAGDYNAALKSYKKAMATDDRRKSQEATLMAARCYLNLGNTQEANRLLEELADEGSGAPRRQAKRLLRDLHKETAATLSVAEME